MPRVTRKGQVTLPQEVRHRLGLKEGSEVEFVVRGDEVLLRKRVSPERIQRWEGYLEGRLPGGSVDAFLREVRGEDE